jgi:N-acetylglucosaminyldiphosphoundecaprenol N-acetyl-beta-D-mannosaminyltransferase
MNQSKFDSPKRIELLGLPVNRLTFRETIDWIEESIFARKPPRQHTVINAAKVVKSRQDLFLRQSIEESHLVNADGQSIVWASRILGQSLPERVTGIDLMMELLKIANQKQYGIFFFGATQDVLDQMLNRIRTQFPRIRIVGSRNGYFENQHAEKIAGTIRDSKPDILFVGMPTPRKEKFIHDYLQFMNVPFSMGVGGSFDVLAGLTQRAPMWMQRAGLEWFYRLLQEPRRLFKRYVFTNTVFLLIVFKALLKGKTGRTVKV